MATLDKPSPPIENRASALGNDKIAVVVLAAGASTRMDGRIKQLLPWHGRTLIENAIALAQQSRADETLVVLGAHADLIRPVVARTGARLVINAEWETGQASSIRAGINALMPDTAAVIFVNADQPFLTSAVIDALIARYRATAAPLIAAMFAGRRGNPALFARVHFAELKNLRGEQGGRALFARYPVVCVEFDDARLSIDLDTFQEYAEQASSNDDF